MRGIAASTAVPPPTATKESRAKTHNRLSSVVACKGWYPSGMAEGERLPGLQWFYFSALVGFGMVEQNRQRPHDQNHHDQRLMEQADRDEGGRHDQEIAHVD